MGIDEHNQFEALIQGLIADDYSSCTDFLSISTLAGLRSQMESLILLGQMNPAGIGNKSDMHEDRSIRRDKVNWIEELSTNEFEQIYIKKVWRFIEYLNKTCFTSITSLESHYSHYEQGSFYKRHLDQFQNEKGRKFSIVLYLNQDWKEEDGGLLSLYPSNRAEKNISPVEGRFVFFRSDEMEHEVHPSSTRNRNSIAGWLKN